MKLTTAVALAPFGLYALGALGPGRRLMKGGLARAARYLSAGRITVQFPDGGGETYQGAAEGPHAALRFKSWSAIRRIVMNGDMGLAEAYMSGEVETPDLRTLLAFGASNQKALNDSIPGLPFVNGLDRLRHVMRPNSKQGSRRNIAYHYDLGNAFYEKWLDENMSYSSAFFTNETDNLPAAQVRKFERLAEELDIESGMRVLEIGCGWGTAAVHLAKHHDVRVTGVTLSEEQFTYARALVRKEGLEDRVDIRLQDYRDVEGVFDRIVSVEMFEAVGEANWPTYFQTVRALLADGARAVLQVITIDNEMFARYRQSCDFIQRYIFPGGMLPSPNALRASAEGQGLALNRQEFFGSSYAETLKIWNGRFQDAWEDIRPLGFDDRFKAMWEYYLAYCEAGFRAGSIDVGHFTLVKR